MPNVVDIVKQPFSKWITEPSRPPSASGPGGTLVASISGVAPPRMESDVLANKLKNHLCSLFKPSLPDTRSLHTLFEFQQSRIEAAVQAFVGLKEDPGVLLDLSRQLQDSRFKGDRAATKAELRAARHLEKDLIGLIANRLRELGMASKDAMREAKTAFHNADTEVLNARAWNTVKTDFEYKEKHYACTMVPAAQMKLGKEDIFPVPYREQGVCSSSTREIAHVPNLWTSEIRASGPGGADKILFKGVRHGILSPFGLEKGSVARHEGSLNRAREVVTAALFAQPELLESALDGARVPLRLVSTSLVTGGKWREGDILDDQVRAWRELCLERPVVLSLKGPDGELREVKIDLEVAAFNFGVNELSLKLKLGQAQSDAYNVTALHQLLGNNLSVSAEPEGWVKDYLERTPAPENKQLVLDLSRRLKQIWAAKAHNHDGGDPYKGALCVMLLANAIDVTPCSNCKSGKDRTGMLDAELKRAVVTLHEGKGLGALGGRLAEDEQLLLQQTLLHGGNEEVQRKNTGAPGNKVMRTPPLVTLSSFERVGNQHVCDQTQGLSQMVEA
ncbi:phosphatidylinositol-4,5-bisphosphate 4-phosphatase [Pseudomonas sp. LAMO17WK12:I10]|uniref:inositol phosphate phosphatase SopB n=1 Tax=unclassified Pseudomonas TaxID=196821 RepID=UPI000BD1F7B8|nr:MULTISPECIES: inositol phosphate phosphatase SopB [unclassified Pseudomonas]PXX54013.1 phosphatidylinositol-4,5-bisphosphate 4-phosphatase [Pseudomonas sp. LAMO17WK12:I9]SNY51958.1 phosphatidylinositol-4,5-bisphosphate 4-phosphatase [Pseudomonas sp. LAMO17WK12:I10]